MVVFTFLITFSHKIINNETKRQKTFGLDFMSKLYVRWMESNTRGANGLLRYYELLQ